MKKLVSMLILMVLTGCGKYVGLANYQGSMAFRTYEHGNDIYHFGGYTDRDELSEADGKKYADAIMKSVCPNGYVLERVTNDKTHNAVAIFGEWHSQGYCIQSDSKQMHTNE